MTLDAQNPAGTTGPPKSTPNALVDRQTSVLQLTGISKTYPGVKALDEVSFEALGGTVHALLGENGAGKSTLMGVASGSVTPDAGSIQTGEVTKAALTPSLARNLGIAIVHQHPALLPDLTVAENIKLGVPEQFRSTNGDRQGWMRRQLDLVGCTAGLSQRAEDISVANRHLLELAKALALDPKVLILDEPTAALGADMVERLFELIRDVAARGTAVVYISHRLPEVRAIADWVTVMRDGTNQATAPIDEMSDERMLELIVGRSVETAFPHKPELSAEGQTLVVEGISGSGFDDISLTVPPSQILGLAGIAGNGQGEFLRALAGLGRARGTVRLNDSELRLGRPTAARAAGITYVSADRHGEGMLGTLSVRENAALTALPAFANGGVVQPKAERRAVEEQRDRLGIRTPSIDTLITALSGGNQQKVVLARSLLAQPSLILVDEPTQGVDAGARVEIYRILRQIANDGIPIIVVSSDGLELEGLCDRVVIFSRGHVVEDLDRDRVTERNIAEAIVTATTHRRGDPDSHGSSPRSFARLRHFAKADWAPSVILLLVILLLGAYTTSINDRVLSAFNLGSALTLLSALALISYGQLIVIITAGIDISVGPLAGLLVVVASFFVVDGTGTGGIVLGFVLMLGVALAVGFVNGALVRFGRFTAVAATLTTFIALQGVSLLLRPTRGGSIMNDVAGIIEWRLGFVPAAFMGVVLLAFLMEFLLRRTRWGLTLRAAGSLEKAAHQLGVPVTRTIVGAYMLAGLFVFLGAIMLGAQIRVGDPAAGIEYTLWSITAVVLGGASLFGGRGSFIGTLLGAALIQQILNATVFLNLTQEWQFWLLGLLTLVAAGIYSQARRAGEVM